MFGQGILCRTFNLITNTRIFLKNRVTHANFQAQILGVKSRSEEVVDITEKPKRPLNAFLRFVMDHRQVVLKENPKMLFQEILKKCGEDWKNADPAIKQKYEREFNTEQNEFIHKQEKFESSLTEEQKAAMKTAFEERRAQRRKRRLNKEKKKLNKPKRPPGPYMLFLMDESKILKKPVPQLMIELKETWQTLPQSEKKKYEEIYKRNLEHYQNALQKWELKMIEEGHGELVSKKTLHERRPSMLLKLQQQKEAESEKEAKDSKHGKVKKGKEQ